jgi:hypothetical protein
VLVFFDGIAVGTNLDHLDFCDLHSKNKHTDKVESFQESFQESLYLKCEKNHQKTNHPKNHHHHHQIDNNHLRLLDVPSAFWLKQIPSCNPFWFFFLLKAFCHASV